MIRIAIFIFDGVEELDFVGPYEVFTMINEVYQSSGASKAVHVQLLSETEGHITGAKGMRVLPDGLISSSEHWDVVLVPGGEGVRPLLENANVLDWLGRQAQHVKWMTSVCTGSMALAKAGLTKGKRVTTHHMLFKEFVKRELDGTLVKDVRYVRDGNIVTAAGVSAGIDMALWLTGRMFSPDLARRVQSAMEYDPKPPYALSDAE
ncbi:MAG: thiamine biosynthesis protein ThiJ [Alphaproteobacteria bacterium]|nr:MAG: thiamine biosynthesis protein ThiJ [Alphaproteobacteria bacterium]